MTQRTLFPFFKPASVAVIGASNQAQKAGNLVIRNLITQGFTGPIMPVNPKYRAVMGILAYPNIESLPVKPELAIICTKASKVPEIVETLARFGCKAAIIVSAEMNQLDSQDESLTQQALKQARRYGMRLLGPDSLGIMVPHIGLNASLAYSCATAGKIAFISQSSAIFNTVLDWANHKKIGFSALVSLGDTCDINFGELLDYLSRDIYTQAILLYVDSVKNSQHFLSAARAASRNKTIIVLKSDSSLINQTNHHLTQNTSYYLENDTVYEAAFRRAGMLRVNELTELFAAVETLAYTNSIKGEKLTILGNGKGLTALALNKLKNKGGQLATLSPATLNKLTQFLPSGWSGQNPVDIMADADAARYGQALDILLEAPELDTVLVLHSPSVLNDSTVVAETVIQIAAKHQQTRVLNILTNWSGENSTYQARKQLAQAGIPSYRTPEAAIGAFMHIVEFHRNQKLLQETPASIPNITNINSNKAHQLLNQAINANKLVLETHEAAEIFAAYGINTISTQFASDTDNAINIAHNLGYPVALKVQSPDLLHKSDVQGVVLNLNSEEEIKIAAQAIISRVHKSVPNAKIQGMLVQKMALTAGTQEIRIAVINDPVFGPAICIDEGGSEWQPTRDAVVSLPPLNMALARYMVIQALKTGKLRDRHLPLGFDIKAICQLLTRLSHLIIDCPQIAELDLNPVLIAGEKITLLDIYLKLNPKPVENSKRLSIQPYPKELEETLVLKNGQNVILRPILPEDEPKHHEFDSSLSAEDRYKRYFGIKAPMTHEEMAVLTQIDYSREMAFIAIAKDEAQNEFTLGAIRASIDPDNTEAEFAMAVRSDHQRLGIGRLLLDKLIRYYQQKGTQSITGFTLLENHNMAKLAKTLGFTVSFDLEEQLIKMEMPLFPIEDETTRACITTNYQT